MHYVIHGSLRLHLIQKYILIFSIVHVISMEISQTCQQTWHVAGHGSVYFPQPLLLLLPEAFVQRTPNVRFGFCVCLHSAVSHMLLASVNGVNADQPL